MLDVHPPHEAAHTWKDFFIHIATIVIGLLIAIGLEQTVEAIHHHHQVADARAQLEVERQINIATFRAQTQEIRIFVPLLQRDLAVLQYLRQPPGAPHSSWPGQLSWYYIAPTYVESSWSSAQESAVLTLMPRREVQQWSALYRQLEHLNGETELAKQLIWRAISYGVRDQDPAAMTPAQLDSSIQATTDALSTYAAIVNSQWNLHGGFQDFSPAPDLSDQRKILHVISPAQDIANAVALNKQWHDEINRIQEENKDK